MKANVGRFDARLRVVVGATAVGLAATGLVGRWGWLGAVPVLSGLIRFCPTYAILGVDSCNLSPGAMKPVRSGGASGRNSTAAPLAD
jgi:hypothetical protein